MAKKQETVEVPVVEAPVVATPKPKKNKWELKDRTYLLKNNMSPLTLTLKSRGLFWFDDEKGYQREVKYCKNQKTVFVDEMQGPQNMEHIVFYEGVLTVPKQNVMLQKLLSLYHPMRDQVYEEWRPEVVAQDEVHDIEVEIQALTTAVNLDVDLMEAVMRVELGSEVSKMSSKELKRDTLLYAKQNPSLFLDLVNDDNVQLRNLGIKAVEQGIVSLSSDQRTFTWSSNNRKLMNVPFDEHPYSALAAWFKTDEGMEIFSNIEKQLK